MTSFHVMPKMTFKPKMSPTQDEVAAALSAVSGAPTPEPAPAAATDPPAAPAAAPDAPGESVIDPVAAAVVEVPAAAVVEVPAAVPEWPAAVVAVPDEEPVIAPEGRHRRVNIHEHIWRMFGMYGRR